MTCVSKLFDSRRFTRCSPFDFLILLNTLCNFLAFGLATLAFKFPVIFLILGLICFCIFRSNILVFCRNSVFCFFYLVNSECGAYQAVDHSLVYVSYPKTFLLFFSLILNLIPVFKTIFLDAYLSFVLVLLLHLLEFRH